MIRGEFNMVGKRDRPKIRCLIKAFLLAHPGKHTSKEISHWITSNDFGIYRGVTPNEVGTIIKEATKTSGNRNPLDVIQFERKHPNSGQNLYWINRNGGK